ncbi:polysaccharide deacetylase family protein [Paenibacillus popilliae]|uniref:ChbG/HpnK family deacetylase n=1 Tax=Paenibacillus popilliae TaxID=78057 RepID=A0ABY3AQI8_PAEPP|nr:polysaccharide deacetylase family protein [Paenibacillus sp. SDF0028]TQR44778.1 ChbG/HpnK family deacetylase [Paenibacillus sp. SDF0028]
MNVMRALGYEETDRLLIINADDFGMCHATNMGIMQLLEEGSICSTSIMMPCGWAKEAAKWSAAHPELDIGVHLTFTSEWEGYKWSAMNRSRDISTLLTEEGYFPEDCLTVEHLADPEQIRCEMISQIEAARRIGINITHADNHMGSLYGLASGRDFLDVVFDVCAAYGLPFRMPRRIGGMKLNPELEKMAKRRIDLADAKGVVILDTLLGLPYERIPGETYAQVKAKAEALLRGLLPGITEMYLHPSIVSDELKAITPHWEKRGMEWRLFRDSDIRRVIAEEGIQLIRWRDLRDVQRGQLPPLM